LPLLDFSVVGILSVDFYNGNEDLALSPPVLLYLISILTHFSSSLYS
jgi:hypothetical protein